LSKTDKILLVVVALMAIQVGITVVHELRFASALRS
jgi:hypothetical protein